MQIVDLDASKPVAPKPRKEHLMKSRLFLLAGASLALLASPALAQTGSPYAPAQPAPVSSTAAATQHAMPAAATTNAAAPAARNVASNTREGRNASLYRHAEKRLIELGLYSGAVDGARNAAYVHSLENFQRAHHIRATGRLTHETERALGI